MITGLFAGIFALAQIILSIRIAKMRWKHKVSLGDGGVDELQTAMRIHGNFVETVPIALILLALMELGGAPLWLVYVLGLAMVISRMSHAYALSTPPGYGRFRVLGMSLTFTIYCVGAATCFWLFLDL